MYRGEFLAQLINDNSLETGAELGLWKGRTFFYLLDHCPTLKLYYGVDEWRYCFERKGVPGGQTYEKWNMPGLECTVREGAAKYGERARIIKADTVAAAGEIAGKLDFVFIDADHTAAGVRRDIEAWKPLIRRGGFLTGHDCVGDFAPMIVPVLEELLPGYRQSSTTDTDAVWWIQL